jgi:peptidoglycan/LPS O-acetylase OafA/YrhL
LAVHTRPDGSFDVPNIVVKIVSEGARGVQLFYLTSAFTLFLSLKKRTAAEHFPIRNFFIRRFFRIAPMYYIAIIVYLFAYGFGPRYWLGDAKSISAANILSNVFFLHGFNPYWINSLVPGGWSIAIEMMFYGILPFLFSRIKSIKQAFNFFVIGVIIQTLLYAILSSFNPTGSDYLWADYLFLYLPSQLPVFGLGIILYFIIMEHESLSDISGKSLLVFCICLLGQLTTGWKMFLFLPHHIVFGIIFFIFAIAISKYKCRVFINPFFIYIGKISFSMYLAHFGVLIALSKFEFIDYVNNGTLNYAIRLVIVIILTGILSTVSYNIIEQPFQKLGRNIIKNAEQYNRA